MNFVSHAIICSFLQSKQFIVEFCFVFLMNTSSEPHFMQENLKSGFWGEIGWSGLRLDSQISEV